MQFKRHRSKGVRVLVAGATIAAVGAIPAAASDTDATAAFHVRTTSDTVDASPGDGRCADASGHCSLRAAVQESNALGAGHIHLDSGATYVLTLTGSGEDAAATGDLDVTGDTTVHGANAKIDANGTDRAFDVAADASLVVSSLRVRNGAPADGESGGAFRSAGSLAIGYSSVAGSVANGTGASGGAIFNSGGHLTVRDSELRGNSATRAGGAIEANAGETHLDGVTMRHNETGPTPGNGGALHLTGAGYVGVADSTVKANTATAEGGGLWNSSTGTMVIADSLIAQNVAEGNDADQGGGGLFNDGGTMTVTGTKVVSNDAVGSAGSGGGILNNLGELTVEDSAISKNTSNRAGGGVEANVGTTVLSRVTMTRNTTGAAPGNGGAFHLTGAGLVSIDQARINHNSASAEGGGLWNSAVGTMVVTDSRIVRNSAPIGDDLFNDGGIFTVDGDPVPVG